MTVRDSANIQRGPKFCENAFRMECVGAAHPDERTDDGDGDDDDGGTTTLRWGDRGEGRAPDDEDDDDEDDDEDDETSVREGYRK